jgi:hypothetical protein
MKDIYQGDPKIYIDNDGADFNLPGNGGQPEMEQGVENIVAISLFTRKGWPGNFFLKEANKKIGSDYEEATEKAITVSNIESLRKISIKALDDDALGEVESTVTVPSSNQWNTELVVHPPGQDQQTIISKKNGQNWLLQAEKGQGA